MTKLPPRRSRQISSPQPRFTEATLSFLGKLARHNDREWFIPRKEEFLRTVKAPMLATIEAITGAMAEFAPEHVRPAEKCMMRIYRDTRFSADKRPYKNQVAAWWSRLGLEKTSGAGYYFHISAKEVVVAAGVYMPDRLQLRALREHFLEHHARLRGLLTDKKLLREFDLFNGLPLTRAPKGFPKDHPALDLLLCRQWGVSCELELRHVLSPDFANQVIRRFRLASKLVNALNEPLVRGAKQVHKSFADWM